MRPDLTIHIFLVLALLMTSCGEEEIAENEAEGATIVISEGNVFSTPDITAPSGGSITIINNDDTPHTLTSQSAENAFDNTGDFDAMIASDGVEILTLPEADTGNIFFYYCRFHTASMNPSGGTITIE